MSRAKNPHLNGVTGASAPNRVLESGNRSERRVLRVWVVEHSPALGELLAQLLNRQPGFRCRRQFDSAATLLAALAEERPPDLIVLDVNHGGITGFGTIRSIRKAAPSVKVLMSAMFGNSHYEAEARRAGASGFLLKSYEIEEIVALLRTAFYNPGAEVLYPNLAALKRLDQERAGGVIPAKKSRSGQGLGLVPALRALCRASRRQLTY